MACQIGTSGGGIARHYSLVGSGHAGQILFAILGMHQTPIFTEVMSRPSKGALPPFHVKFCLVAAISVTALAYAMVYGLGPFPGPPERGPQNMSALFWPLFVAQILSFYAFVRYAFICIDNRKRLLGLLLLYFIAVYGNTSLASESEKLFREFTHVSKVDKSFKKTGVAYSLSTHSHRSKSFYMYFQEDSTGKVYLMTCRRATEACKKPYQWALHKGPIQTHGATLEIFRHEHGYNFMVLRDPAGLVLVEYVIERSPLIKNAP